MAYWLDDGFDTWPEVVRAGKAATGLYVCCGAWIARNLTDGFVPAEVATMYGTPEWVTRLVAAGLWSIEGDGYRDVFYLVSRDGTKLNPLAEKVAERKVAKAERQRRWLEKTHSRRGSRPPRDASQDVSADLPPALPPSLKGRTGDARAAPLGAPRVPQPDHPPSSYDEDPTVLAAEQARLAQEAEARVHAIADAQRATANGAARVRAALNGRTRASPPRPDALDELRRLTDPPPDPHPVDEQEGVA